MGIAETKAGCSMGIRLDLATIVTGLLIFLARVTDVSVGTMRTISIVQGRTKTAFFLGLVEISVWLAAISTVLSKIVSQPVLGAFYAFGFAAGNVVGIELEKRIAFGHLVLRVVSSRHGEQIAARMRGIGYAVTTFPGEGMAGPVTLLYVVCRRRDLKCLIPIVRSIEPDAFYVTEQAGTVSKIRRPFMQQRTGWRAIFKKK
jgi:uncharacterized protein YebE (UPF0316 family)